MSWLHSKLKRRGLVSSWPQFLPFFLSYTFHFILFFKAQLHPTSTQFIWLYCSMKCKLVQALLNGNQSENRDSPRLPHLLLTSDCLPWLTSKCEPKAPPCTLHVWCYFAKLVSLLHCTLKGKDKRQAYNINMKQRYWRGLTLAHPGNHENCRSSHVASTAPTACG